MAFLPYPRRPLKSSHGFHRIHRIFWREIFSHGFHRCPQMVRLRKVLPRNSRNSQKFLAEDVLPRNSQNSQKFLSENILPRISQMPTEVSGVGYSPTDFTDAHRFLGCVFAPNLCTSVQSVGVFVGGYGILPYPRHPPRGCTCLKCTNRAIVGGYGIPAIPTPPSAIPPTEFTEFTEVSVGEEPPTDFTDAHRSLGCVFAPNLCTSVQSVGIFVGGYGIPAIPTSPSEVLPQNSRISQKRMA